MLASLTNVLAEVLVVGEQAGVSRRDLMRFINDSVMASPFTRMKTGAFVGLDLAPTFPPEGLHKDVRLMLDTAADHRVAMPTVSAAEQALHPADSFRHRPGHGLRRAALAGGAQGRPRGQARGGELAVSDEQSKEQEVALVPLPDKDNMDPADLPAIETGLAAFGHLLHTWQAVANVPGLFSKYFPFLRALTGPGALDQRIKELTAVQVAILNHCRYTVCHRSFSALAKGVTEAELVKIAANDLRSFSETERLALEFTRAVTLDVPARHRRRDPGRHRRDAATARQGGLRTRAAGRAADVDQPVERDRALPPGLGPRPRPTRSSG